MVRVQNVEHLLSRSKTWNQTVSVFLFDSQCPSSGSSILRFSPWTSRFGTCVDLGPAPDSETGVNILLSGFFPLDGSLHSGRSQTGVGPTRGGTKVKTV